MRIIKLKRVTGDLNSFSIQLLLKKYHFYPILGALDEYFVISKIFVDISNYYETAFEAKSKYNNSYTFEKLPYFLWIRAKKRQAGIKKNKEF